MARNTRTKFIKFAALLWGSTMLLIVLIALLAPYFGRLADMVLQQTTYRDWVHLVLTSERKFFDPSTPFNTIKSYYSALYHGDDDAMRRLTSGAFQHQIRARLREAQLPDSSMTYRSYLHTSIAAPQQAVVAERFHLFWRQGLVFHLSRREGVWRISQVQLTR